MPKFFPFFPGSGRKIHLQRLLQDVLVEVANGLPVEKVLRDAIATNLKSCDANVELQNLSWRGKAAKLEGTNTEARAGTETRDREYLHGQPKSTRAFQGK